MGTTTYFVTYIPLLAGNLFIKDISIFSNSIFYRLPLWYFLYQSAPTIFSIGIKHRRQIPLQNIPYHKNKQAIHHQVSLVRFLYVLLYYGQQTIPIQQYQKRKRQSNQKNLENMISQQIISTYVRMYGGKYVKPGLTVKPPLLKTSFLVQAKN